MQRSPLLSITNAYSTTSTDTLHVLSGFPPLDLKVRIDVVTSQHIQRIKNSREIGGLQSFDFETAREPWEVVKISWSLFDESETFGNVIYTDGSKIQNRVGCAFVYFQENDEIFSELFRLSDEATVFLAEVVAIRQAVKYIIGRQLMQAKIISDSRSALMFLASVHERRVIINEIKDNIKEYLRDIQLIWIRAHRGFEGNESAGKDGLDKGSCGFLFLPF
ncbi:hypothetical protein AVEN_92243-1 [Araneus ventricosus]|uniref:RNase H type-1 domain-containing protein n=1 Tax=Araneus ventricosus TaxID=182803 RepID=A0A4Y2AL10_ARAVE|nr:hypothetical protein AVEN_92243-1 [Araneus ventricosus]